MIRITYNYKFLNFDWLMKGFRIRDTPKFVLRTLNNKTETIFEKHYISFLIFNYSKQILIKIIHLNCNYIWV